MTPISEIKLIRTDTTLDLSQKAEKVWIHKVGLTYKDSNPTKWNCGLSNFFLMLLNKFPIPGKLSHFFKFLSFFLSHKSDRGEKVFSKGNGQRLSQFLLGKAYTYLRFATILQRILVVHMCVLRHSTTWLGDKRNKKKSGKPILFMLDFFSLGKKFISQK